MENNHLIGSGLISLIGYIFLIYGVWKNKFQINLFTAVAWFFLSMVTMIMTCLLGQEPLPAFLSVLLTFASLVLVLFLSFYQIPRPESRTLGMIKKTMAVMFIVGILWWIKIANQIGFSFFTNNATIYLLIIATIPQIVDVYEYPNSKLLAPFLFMSLASVVSLIGGHWSLIDMRYILTDGALSFIIVLLLIIKRRKYHLTT